MEDKFLTTFCQPGQTVKELGSFTTICKSMYYIEPLVFTDNLTTILPFELGGSRCSGCQYLQPPYSLYLLNLIIGCKVVSTLRKCPCLLRFSHWQLSELVVSGLSSCQSHARPSRSNTVSNGIGSNWKKYPKKIHSKRIFTIQLDMYWAGRTGGPNGNNNLGVTLARPLPVHPEKGFQGHGVAPSFF